MNSSHPIDNSRWRVLGASFVSYGFDAMDFMILALSLALITQELGLTLSEAGLLGTVSGNVIMTPLGN